MCNGSVTTARTVRFGHLWRACGGSTFGDVKKFAALIAAVAVLATAAPAGAVQYWNGWVTRGTDDADCVWYRGQAACAGWNYWAWNYVQRWGYYPGTLLLGFENRERIRGFENTSHADDRTEVVIPAWLGMGGYLIAHGTWWNGSGVQATLDART